MYDQMYVEALRVRSLYLSENTKMERDFLPMRLGFFTSWAELLSSSVSRKILESSKLLSFVVLDSLLLMVLLSSEHDGEAYYL